MASCMVVNSTSRRCKALHEWLLEEGVVVGARIPRKAWDQMLSRGLGLGNVQVQNITRSGDLLGYWRRNPHHGPIQGSIQLLEGPGSVGGELGVDDAAHRVEVEA